MVKGEIITAAEALRRVGLADLIGEHEAREDEWGSRVEWTGTPKPFPCGHTAVYGYGPLRGYNTPEEAESEKANDRTGSHREYKGLHRVNLYHCGGQVLFSWTGVGLSYPNGDKSKAPLAFHLRTSMVVTIDTLPDSKSTAMRVAWSA